MMKNIIIATIALASSVSQAAAFDICVCDTSFVSSGPAAGNGYSTLNGKSYVKNQDGSVTQQVLRLTTLETIQKPKGQPDVIERAFAMCEQTKAQFIAKELCPPESPSK